MEIMISLGYHKILLAFLLAFSVCLIIGPVTIKLMQKLKFGQQVRDDGPASHLKKQNVPTMGGIMMVIAIGVCAVVFRFKGAALVATLATVGYGIIGFLDDFIKIYKKRSLGLRAYQKIIGQLGIALIAAWYGYKNLSSAIYVPFKGYVDMGVWYIPFAVFVILAIVNGENLADGLDGLASRMTLVQGTTLALIIPLATFLITTQEQAEVFNEQKLMLAILASSMAGSCLGFLRFNTYPARIFMGDTGALALGGCLAMCALYSRTALLLPVMCIMLVLTCVSVILQVGSYKLRHGKRIFKMAPLHHHYELLGYHETTVTSMYTLITVVACIISVLLAYKI
ncbi:MAG: phospho-N-acetylmuramoyl-pentapeptide-transferase [Clostridia bacterium]|nr:phospho-N-acetylmuramoyl-pentapeptide-transferase [Clostridia bacterium]